MKRKPIKGPNLAAKALLTDRNFRMKIVRDRTKYSRKGRKETF